MESLRQGGVRLGAEVMAEGVLVANEKCQRQVMHATSQASMQSYRHIAMMLIFLHAGTPSTDVL